MRQRFPGPPALPVPARCDEYCRVRRDLGPHRLSPADRISLDVETADWPMHVGAVALLDGSSLRDDAGLLRLDDIRRTLAARIAGRLRQVVRTGVRGSPVWMDDPDFRIERQVSALELPEQPGGLSLEALLEPAERLLRPRLGRRNPMWGMWFVTAGRTGPVGLVVALHHSLADGTAATRLIASLFDPPLPQTSAVPGAGRPGPARRPSPAVAAAARWRLFAHAWRGPRTSLNTAVGPDRRLGVLTLDLDAVRDVAHRHAATVTDVVLTLAAGGLAGVLSQRGEPLAGVALHAAVAASTRTPGRAAVDGNSSGIVVARLPLDEPDPARRLDLVRFETATVKRTQLGAGDLAAPAWLARTRLARRLMRRQRLTNTVVSSVVGPAQPLRLLGAQVRELAAVGVLSGNLTVAFLALSYAGRLSVAVRADAHAVPDLPVLLDEMKRDWAALRA
jgi:hypothetical protein